jgi:hypothetical protein
MKGSQKVVFVCLMLLALVAVCDGLGCIIILVSEEEEVGQRQEAHERGVTVIL